VVGDGPQRGSLHQLAKALGIDNAVTFTGLLPGPATLTHFQRADVLVFPSLREFGGAVVFEALGLGAVPIVADFGGPGDIVTAQVGYKIPLVNESDMVSKLGAILAHLANNPTHLETLRRCGMGYAREQLSWEGKARLVSSVLLWATGRGPKPKLAPPARPNSSSESSDHRQQPLV
jgi:glycosyltransferase involved in cell wall biosynthesis